MGRKPKYAFRGTNTPVLTMCDREISGTSMKSTVPSRYLPLSYGIFLYLVLPQIQLQSPGTDEALRIFIVP